VSLAKFLLRAHAYADGLAAAEAATSLEPDSVEAQAMLATALRLALKLDLAERAARRAIELDPQRAEGYDDLGMTLRARHRLDDAETQEREAIRRAPRNPLYRINLAVVLKDAGKMHEARQAYRALSAELAHASALPAFVCQTLGTLALECDADLEATRRWSRRAAEGGEADAAALSEALADLMEWKFDRAWENFEARKRVREQRERHDLFTAFPAWDGSALADERLLVYGEQGVGDEIMYASMIPDLQRRARNITLLCDPRLQQLFARSFPGVEVVRGTHDTVDALKGQVSCAVASGSLGMHFRRSTSDFPARASYLRPDAAKVARWRKRLGELGAGRKIGVSWLGGLQRTGRNRRSLSLAQLRAVLSAPGVDWISLQHGDCAEEIARFAEQSGIRVHHFPGVTDDIDDLAALIEALELVVSVSNTTVHVAGALGKPVLVLAAHVPLWLYGLRGERMAWYPSARVFRQREDFSWHDALSQVEAAVAGGVRPA
jgi:Tfp pilus assembly protein PilF